MLTARDQNRSPDLDRREPADHRGHRSAWPGGGRHRVSVDLQRLDRRIAVPSRAADGENRGSVVVASVDRNQCRVVSLARQAKRRRPGVTGRIEDRAAVTVHQEHTTIRKTARGVAFETDLGTILERCRHGPAVRGIPRVQSLGGPEMSHVIRQSSAPASDHQHRAVGQRNCARFGAGFEQ